MRSDFSLNTCGTMPVRIGSHYMATETPARGARGQGWRRWFLNSTERCPSRCVRVKVHQGARRLKFYAWACPVSLQFAIRKFSACLRLHLKLEKIQHTTCRAPVWLVGVELVRFEGRIFNLVQSSGDSNSALIRGCGVDVEQS